MAIASGVPVPAVYVLRDEPGSTPSRPAIRRPTRRSAVTRGALEKLDRDELQGVIAHEFSHILNGDMRLNMRLIGVLFGSARGRTASAARCCGFAPRARTQGPARTLIAGRGLAVMVLGYVGVFFGRLIQAAVSRQRECLADASAVQFTREPQGLRARW